VTWNIGTGHFAHEPSDEVIDVMFTEVSCRHLVPVTSASSSVFFRIHPESAEE